MTAETEKLISALRDQMETMTDDERTYVIARLMIGYCIECGAKLTSWGCYCTRDE